MTQEEKKNLLLRDLCARLPYGVKIYYRTAGWEDKNNTLTPQVIDNFLIRSDVVIKPYLRPMSSMTEEEKMKLSLSQIYAFTHYNEIAKIDWLNKHHFDYRGLIDRGFAIEVTDDNNPYESTSETY